LYVSRSIATQEPETWTSSPVTMVACWRTWKPIHHGLDPSLTTTWMAPIPAGALTRCHEIGTRPARRSAMRSNACGLKSTSPGAHSGHRSTTFTVTVPLGPVAWM
jgi:hypothetical protein